MANGREALYVVTVAGSDLRPYVGWGLQRRPGTGRVHLPSRYAVSDAGAEGGPLDGLLIPRGEDIPVR
jgi:hypothetical protein